MDIEACVGPRIYGVCLPEIGETCAAFANKYAECFDELPGIDLGCEETLMESFAVSMACGEAREELLVCLDGLESHAPDTINIISSALWIGGVHPTRGEPPLRANARGQGG